MIAFAEDVAASGGYMIACAADEIICDPSSIVGSIGVVGGSFGFARLMDKLGIERRLYTSGEHKAMLDPFLPENPEDVERLKAVQREIHEDFIDLVKRSRGARLKGPEKTLFSGEYWTGSKAIELGLADGIGDLRATLRARFGDDVVTPLVSPARGWFGRVQPGVARSRRFAAPPGFRRGDRSRRWKRARCGRVTDCEDVRTGDRPCHPSSSRRWSRLRWVSLGAGAVVHWVVKEVRRINAELDRVKAGTAIDPVVRQELPTLRRDPRTGDWRVM